MLFQPADDGLLKNCFMILSYVPPGAQKGFIMDVLDTNSDDDIVSKMKELAEVGIVNSSLSFLVSSG